MPQMILRANNTPLHSKNCVVVFSEVNLNQLRSWSIWLLSGRINNWTSGSFWLRCKCYAMTCTIQPRKRVVFAAGMRIDIRGFTNSIILNCLYFLLSDKLFTPLDLEYSWKKKKLIVTNLPNWNKCTMIYTTNYFSRMMLCVVRLRFCTNLESAVHTRCAIFVM